MELHAAVNLVEDDDALRIKSMFLAFLREYSVDGEVVYKDAIADLALPERNTLHVSFREMTEFDGVLSQALLVGYFRFYPYICDGVRQLAMEFVGSDEGREVLKAKHLFVDFRDVPVKKAVRELRAEMIGHLVRISGQVVRTHPVHPELWTGTFVCDECGVTIRNIQQNFRFTPPCVCANPQCQNRTNFSLDMHECAFVDFQRVRIQEVQAELPRGCIPLNVDVIMRGETVEQVQPGDHVDFTGMLIVTPDVSALAAPGFRADMKNHKKKTGGSNDAAAGLQGLKSLGVRELNYGLAFLATGVAPTVQTFEDMPEENIADDFMQAWEALSGDDRKLLMTMSKDKDLVKNLKDALFPHLFGNDDVKLGILLMLCGGVPKQGTGFTLRGDINVLLVGDPSCGKSQFLKSVKDFSSRAVYTSGKASSAAGLTAAVVRDEESSDFVIEAGALMLADNGVCCIDEFDKMDLKDQVAIHEAMEQQTISITKAGVKATLNARASVLAAANPVGGRYDKSRSLKYNVQLSDPIMSRFDLFFVLTDECNDVLDYAIAKRILDNAMSTYTERAPPKYSTQDVRKYIAFVGHFEPVISVAARERLAEEYKRLRRGTGDKMTDMSSRSTVRQMESLVRLSEAMARLQCLSEVTVEHVENATKLLTKCFVRLDKPEVELDDDFNNDLDFGDEVTDENAMPADEQPSDDVMAKTTGRTTESFKISHENYIKIRELLVTHIRLDEGRETDENWQGVRRKDLIEWYLAIIEDEIEDVEELARWTRVTELVVKRLTDVENVLIEITTDADGEPLLVDNPDFEL